MNALRLLLALCALGLAALVAWALREAHVLSSFGSVLADPWGLVAIVDLYVGFIAISVLVWVLARLADTPCHHPSHLRSGQSLGHHLADLAAADDSPAIHQILIGFWSPSRAHDKRVSDASRIAGTRPRAGKAR